jgi:hypothetical protein
MAMMVRVLGLLTAMGKSMGVDIEPYRSEDVTDLQGGAAEGAGLEVTDLQGSDGHGFAKAGVRNC